MTSFWEQLKLLLWKNWVLRKRHKTRVFMELLWPLILFMILMWVRTRGLKLNRPSCHLVGKALPSVGGFEFVQNFFCTLNNTCHDKYIENQGNRVWEESTIIRFVKDTSPLITNIVESPKGVQTLGKIWQDLLEYMQLLSAFQTRDPTTAIGQSKLEDFMSKTGRKAFVITTPSYTPLSEEQATALLQSTVYLDNANKASVEELIEGFLTGKCSSKTNYDLIHFTDETLVKDLCEMSRDQLYIVAFLITNYIEKDGLVKKLKGNTELESVLEKENKRKSNILLEYDWDTLGNLAELGKVMSNFGSSFDKFSKLNGTDFTGAVLYEGICGHSENGNQTFGFDPGQATRFDSLRDRLKDWNPDHYYEPDTEISAACNTIFQRLESMPFTALLWRQLKPFIRGVIYFSPDTPVTRAIMEKVEEKFLKLKGLENSLNSVVNVIHRVRKFMRTNSEEIANILTLLSDPKNVDVIAKVAGVKLSQSQKTQFLGLIESISSSNVEVTLERLDFMTELLSELMGCVKYDKAKGFPTEYEAVNAGIPLLSSEKLWAVVVFANTDENTTSIPNHLVYKIRMDSDKVDGTRASRDRLTSKSPRRRPSFDLKYITNGFAYLQEMIERSVIEIVTGKSMDGLTTYLQQFPYPCHVYDQFIRAISRTFPLFMVLSWVYASSMIVKSVVMEKELRLKEVMRVMGLGNGVIWCGWFIDSFIIMSFSATMLTVILKYGKVIENSDVTLIWVFMMSYTVTTINFSFLVSTFFTRANSAAAAGGILFFVSYLPYNMLLIWEEQLSWYHTLMSCLISNVAFGFGCTYFARYEEDGVGAQWSRISLTTLPGDDFNLSYCILMLWFDTFLYWLLTWYIEAIFPGAAGVPKPWNFFIKKSYWKGRKLPRSPTKVLYETVPELQGPEDCDFDQPIIEAEPEGFRPGVVVTNLGKTYSNGKTALKDLSINFYEDQITSFLGHNGAGKTTTISILTGLFPPSSGTARIDGLDIHKDMDSIRQGTGICPQYNTLFDRLTVEEHMQFYAGLKGKYDSSFEQEFTQIISDLGIPHKRHEFPNNLSGGMRRKLSVACSFIGGSKTVFLDEPTSGVDPYSRRSIWELLLKYKKGRTIILTTHFMDEADLLGDRIAIISHGRLKACGSSLFLKSHFGQGYSLRLVREDPIQRTPRDMANNKVNGNNETAKGSNIEQRRAIHLNPSHRQAELLKVFVQKLVPECQLVDDVGSEVVLLLPYPAVKQFPALFHTLDTNLGVLGITSYGISDTTLEDVFLKITISDIEANADSFHSLSSSCKRRVTEILKRMKVGTCPKKAPLEIHPIGPNHPPPTCPPTKVVTVSSEPIVLRTPNKGKLSVGSTSAIARENRSIQRIDVESNGGSRGSVPPTLEIIEALVLAACPSSNGNEETLDCLLEEGGCPSQEDEFPVRGTDWKRCACCMALIQIAFIYLKRLWNSARNMKAMFFEIILPAVFIAITLAFTLILPPATDEPPREITPWTYPSPNYIFFSESLSQATSPNPSFSSFINELVGPVGLGTACVNDESSRKLCDSTTWTPERVAEFNSSRMAFKGYSFPKCSCKQGSLQCPSKVEKVRPPSMKSPTRDILQDVTHLNIPEWIEKTYRAYETSRYGGFDLQVGNNSHVNITNFVDLLDKITSGEPPVKKDDDDDDAFSLSYSPSVEEITAFRVWYENRGWVSSVAYLNAMHNIFLRANLPDELKSNASSYGMTLYTHPLNLTKSQSTKESIKTAGLGVIHAVCIIFALSFVPASFTVYLIEERKSGGKHLHLVSGVKPITYWIANLLYDLSKYLVPVILSVILFVIFGAKAYIGAPSWGAFLILLLLYGWASIPAMYPFSFFFAIPSTAFVVLACLNLFVGVMTTVSTFVLEQFGDPELEAIGAVLKQVFLIFPHYCLGRGLMELVRLDVESLAYEKLAIHVAPKDRFEWDHLGKMLVFLGIQGVVFFLLNLALEYRALFHHFCRGSPRQPILESGEDEDVAKERARVLADSSPETTSALRAESLTKYYSGKKHPAVNGLTFAIQKGECFGLLGVNGAGKSSSFKMLTGDVRITSGKAKVCGQDVETQLDSARQHFGYCPQEDGLDPLLDAYELLHIYGRLRGMTARETDVAVRKLIHTLGLTKCARRRTGTFSGGNKRKLSTAIALIGDPDVVFLDEPTSGMDPASRRRFWKVILRLVRLGKSVVLTSHSMEECEALCSRIAIMVNGQFTCLGSLQHLKNRFGDGYTVTVRCPKSGHSVLLARLEADLPSAKLEDVHCSQLKLCIPQSDARLSDIFNSLCALKDSGLIEDYSVSQTTLDDIFVKFASEQKDDMDR